MSKRTQIERALWEINQADFQRLGDTYIRRRGYTHINPIGLAIGRDKTTTGTPDTLVVRDDGKYVFVEYTTQEKGVAAKFEADLTKCLNEEDTGVPLDRIAEVVLCHNGKLNPDEELTLRVLCEAHGVQLTTIGLGEIAADLVEKYPLIAEEFLGIEISSGQILNPQDFVSKYRRSALATPLDTPFLFRDKEIKTALQHLQGSNVVLLTGKPGVGKTRLALEIAHRYMAMHAGTQAWFILNRGVDLSRELKTHFAEPGDYLIVVDDANRMSGFQYVLDLLLDLDDRRSVKIIATVRDYALDAVAMAAKPFGPTTPIAIEPMSTDQIHDLVGQVHGIGNPLFLERIAQISNGIPRLALMAASLATKEGVLSSLNDATALYEEYFDSISRDLHALKDSQIVLVAGIVAFFRNVDRTHGELMGVIRDTFGLDAEVFWRAVRTLHDFEVVDLYENEVVRISDQVLATYLFFTAAFKDKSLDLTLLFASCFPRFRQRFIDVLNPILSTFDSSAVNASLKPHVLRALEAFQMREDNNAMLETIETFPLLIPEKTLMLVQAAIGELSVESLEGAQLSFTSSSSPARHNSIVSILSQFYQAEPAQRSIAIELALAYLEKQPKETPFVVRMLEGSYGVGHRSYAEGYERERQVVELLLKASDQGRHPIPTGLLLAYAGHCLQVAFHTLKPTQGRAFTSINFTLAETSELRLLRNRIWEAVLSLVDQPSFQDRALRVIERYLGSGLRSDSKQVISGDVAFLSIGLATRLDPSIPRQAIIVNEFVQMTDRLGIAVDPKLEETFGGEVAELYELFTGSKTERKGLEWNEYEQVREQQVNDYADGLDSPGISRFLDHAERLIRAMPETRHWEVNGTVSRVIGRVISREPSIVKTELIPRLREQRGPHLSPYGIVNVLVDKLGADRALEVLTFTDYPNRWHWLLVYCMSLQLADVGEQQLQIVLDGYENAPVSDIPVGLDHLLVFQGRDATIHRKIARILHTRLERKDPVARIVARFFGRVGDLGRLMPTLFKDDIELVKRLYLASAEDQGFDYDVLSLDDLITLDPGFAQEWTSWIITKTHGRGRGHDHRDYSRLWLRPDHVTVMNAMFDATLDTNRTTFSFESYLLVLFRVREDHADKSDIWARQDDWLEGMIRSHSNDRERIQLLFDVVGNLPVARRVPLIRTLLSVNSDFDLFSTLRLEPSMRSWRGSAVPMYQKEIDFYKALLDSCNSVALLKHREHFRSLIERRESLVDQERKRDFIGD
jgi:hypothetical protein